jgi:nucleotide-binding universal stress UspA family protein
MIKRILVALDPDSDTPIATRYAIRLARRFDASLTGLAVIDQTSINLAIDIGGYGTEATGHQIWSAMASDSREVADKLLTSFKNEVDKEGVRSRNLKKHGASFELIIEEMKYHDLLVVGRDSHFFYNQPETESGTLAQIVKGGTAPTMVVMDQYKNVERIMVAFDGSGPAAKTLKSFVHLLPYGKDLEIELVNVTVGNSSQEMNTAATLLNQAEDYLKEHNFRYITKTVLEPGDHGERILNHQEEKKPDLLLLGAHSVSAIRRITFGSTTHHLFTQSQGPLFLCP